LHTLDAVKAYLDNPGTYPIWLKQDTGMHRLGMSDSELHEALALLAPINPKIQIMSHLASAEEAPSAATDRQLQYFISSTESLSAPRSLANSAGTLCDSALHFDWVRPGIMLYGADPLAKPNSISSQLKPVMKLTAPVIAVRQISSGESVGYNGIWTAERDSVIATIAIGYGDGYPRHAPNGTPVLIGKTRYPLVGRVSMDMITVDITDQPDIETGELAVLWGDEQLRVEEVARLAATIPYHLLTGINPRVHYRYINNEAE
jgi:alanine racemase